ncbi:SNF2 family N-terminal domain-containing protein [Mycena galopus ATCC 62051]|nr:SNF2 family N-terminal domain-containing protein [Mycena galopus ATCC 62051]
MASPNHDDPALLFTPQKSVAPSKSHHQLFDVVEVPVMASAQKATYKPRGDSDLTDTVKYTPDEIIGEYKEQGQLWYYARYKGGIAHKFKVEDIQKSHPDLVSEYLRKQAADELAEFDPAAHYVHPKSRVRMRVRIGKDHARSSISINGSVAPSSDVEVVPDSEADGEDESDDEEEKDDDEYEAEGSPIKPRRSTRSAKLPRQNLPFSPKKTRSQKIVILDSDEGETPEGSTTNAGTRRSTRSHKGFKINLDEGAYYESDQEDNNSEGYDSAPKLKRAAKPPKATRKKGSRPAYGHVRGVEDIEYDPNSDEETAALRAHRDTCEKCHENPAHEQLAALSKRKGKGRKRRKTTDDEFEESGDEAERASKRGGWVRCLKCPVANHWNCLSRAQQEEILKAAREIDRAAWRSTRSETELQLVDENGKPKANPNEPGKRPGLDPQQTTDFICGACTKGGVCMGCMETALEPDAAATSTKFSVEAADTGSAADKDVEMADATKSSNLKYDSTMALLFRCLLCKRLGHYEHMPTPSDFPSDSDIPDIATHYTTSWLCADCSSFRFDLDKIIAWRPYPANAIEPPRDADEAPPHYKTPLPREYLVKWMDRSYRRTQWVPHMWLVSTNGAKLKNFLAVGSKVELLEEPADDTTPDDDGRAQFQVIVESRDSSVKPGGGVQKPAATVDRVLDVLMWRPAKKAPKRKGKAERRIESDDDRSEDEPEERTAALDEGEEPSSLFTESLEQWEERKRRKFTTDDADEVAWIFVKWDDLTYDEATWDSPPRSSDSRYYPAFKTALSRFIAARQVFISEGGKPAKHDRKNDGYDKLRIDDASELDLGQDPAFKLMDFQVDGFNWLCLNWWNHQHCILADEMGLGKTVQIATFIGKAIGDFGAKPALVVVPNSTITNWVREFERWAPNLRVVPFYGEAKSREIIRKYELTHATKKKGFTSAKFHVLVTTYETLSGKDFTTVFKNQPRWEILVVDEGQRLKSDSSLLFKKLNELKTLHRIIMTGTPLNNNIRELFNLMNFLDPASWNDLEALEEKYDVLTEDLVKELHNLLRPYFLRRIKSQVLKLPPKNEVIVPVSMAPLQKEIYRSILSHNLDLLNGLTGPKAYAASKGKLNNVLMHLRKCLQHPYLYEETIEPRGLPEREAHEKLIDGSAKLRFLKVLLPKLKARGHRVLLFSQFVIALNVIEDFLTGEGHRFLRLDGNTKSKDRQKGMDEFNREGSDVFIYLLTTRAGGVGINLFSADTVIIFDPDFNPHQAIARAYRYGQKNTCLVFKLMVKDSAEERIVQVGKKKLILDHLIVQKMDDDDDAGDNVESILTYGAQALFEADAGARDIAYTDTDIDKLIDKTEQEAEPEQIADQGALSFSFAKVWAAEKDTLEEVVEEEDQGDSWAQTLQKINEDRDRVRANDMATSGRGARRRAAAPKQNAYLIDDSPAKGPGSRQRSQTDDIESAYGNSSDSEEDIPIADGVSAVAEALNEAGKKSRKSRKKERKVAAMENGPLAPIQNLAYQEPCSLCGARHGDQLGECMMTEKSEHLAEFREMLLLHPEDEPLEKRRAAIEAIDEILHQRGHVHLVMGQPLEIVERSILDHPQKKSKSTAAPNQASGSSTAGNPVASSSTARPPTQSNAVASSSKRTLSPTLASNPPHKKAKTSSSSICIICGSSPHHLAKDCSVVSEGPKRITREIKRLELVPGTGPTVEILRKILVKQKKREIKTPAEVIEVSD